MNLLGKIAISLLPAAVLAGCNSGGGSIEAPAGQAPQTAQIRFIHASPDAPDVNIEISVDAGAATVASALPYKSATAFRGVLAETIGVRVEGIVPGGVANVIGPVDLPLSADTAYSVIAIGNVAEIDALVLDEPVDPVPAGSVRAQVVHGAPNAPAVDLFVTAPGAPLDQAVPLGSFAFGENLGPVEIPAGDYQIRVTLPGDPATVVFDSGTVALPSGSDLLVVAVENTGPGEAPISLVVADGLGSFEIFDAATPAEVRVIHASPDAPPVDVVVDDDFANPLLSDFPYPAFSGYFAVPPASHNVKVTAANNPGAIVIDADLDLSVGTQYSVYASDVLASIEPFVLVDDDRSVVTEAKVRILHLAPGAGLVDLYVTAPGTDISAIAPTFAGIDFRADTGYVSLAAGSYDVTVTAAGSSVPAIGPATIEVSNGGVYTAVARDAEGGGAPFGLILMDDFTP